MKIALFHHLPDGGARVALFEQIKRLNKKHRIDLYTFIEEEGEYDLKPFCKRVFLYPYEATLARKRGLARIWEDAKSFTTLKKIHRGIAEEIDRGGYDVAYIHQSRLTNSPFILRFLKTPSLYYCQEPLRIAYEYDLRLKERVGPVKKAYESLNRFIRKRIDRSNAQSATIILASSHYIWEYVARVYGVYPQICPLGVDSDSFSPSALINRKGLLFVGGEAQAKGQHLAEKAVEKIPKYLRPTLKIISSTTSGRFTLKKKQMLEAYNRAQVTICTSILEPFGLVALESMACETPVIAVREGGYRETVLDGVTGFLVDRDSVKISDKIIKILKDPQLGRKLGKAGRKHVIKNWNWEKGITVLEEVLKKTAKTR